MTTSEERLRALCKGEDAGCLVPGRCEDAEACRDGADALASSRCRCPRCGTCFVDEDGCCLVCGPTPASCAAKREVALRAECARLSALLAHGESLREGMPARIALLEAALAHERARADAAEKYAALNGEAATLMQAQRDAAERRAAALEVAMREASNVVWNGINATCDHFDPEGDVRQHVRAVLEGAAEKIDAIAARKGGGGDA